MKNGSSETLPTCFFPLTSNWILVPISGEIIEGNKSIVDDPVSVNTDPEGASWFFKLKIQDKSELDTLMSQVDYEKFVAENPS